MMCYTVQCNASSLTKTCVRTCAYVCLCYCVDERPIHTVGRHWTSTANRTKQAAVFSLFLLSSMCLCAYVRANESWSTGSLCVYIFKIVYFFIASLNWKQKLIHNASGRTQVGKPSVWKSTKSHLLDTHTITSSSSCANEYNITKICKCVYVRVCCEMQFCILCG